MRRNWRVMALLLAGAVWMTGRDARAADHAQPGTRSVMDAHNCYPYFEWWGDRIQRALSTGTPLAIEQDLAWYTDPKTGRSWSVVTHGAPLTGQEPTLEHYFFDTVRPVVERALASGDRSQWPLITLNLDFKDEKPEHLRAIRALLQSHADWITSARKTAEDDRPQPLEIRPILVLTGEADAQQKVFHDELQDGERIYAFGAIHSAEKPPTAAPEVLDTEAASNYRRWWNNSWRVVEPAGQPAAGAWTAARQERLQALVKHAHANGLWIRFYTLDGSPKADLSANGWFHGYNFGSLAAVRIRWKAAIAAGVDYIASDQYELLARQIHASEIAQSRQPSHSAVAADEPSYRRIVAR